MKDFIEAINKDYDTKREALDFMEFNSYIQQTLTYVENLGKWVVTYNANKTQIEGQE